MLEEYIYYALSTSKLPVIPNFKPLAELVLEHLRENKRRRVNYLNTVFSIKAKSTPKLTSIRGELLGYRGVFRGAYMVKSGEALRFRATYEYTGRKPETIVLDQSMDDTRYVYYVLFAPKSTYVLESTKSINEPCYLTCKAITKPRAQRPLAYLIDYVRLYNELTQTYPIGLYDDRYKPVSEYPVEGVNNAVLDAPYSWRVENRVYPMPAPDGFVFDNLSVILLSGFINYEGKHYKDPATNNIVRATVRFTNNTAYTLTLRHYGLVLAVLYEDDMHASQGLVDVTFPDTTLLRGSRIEYYFDVSLPTWAYGKVLLAHAINFYIGNRLYWTGGPLYCFEVFRVRLP